METSDPYIVISLVIQCVANAKCYENSTCFSSRLSKFTLMVSSRSVTRRPSLSVPFVVSNFSPEVAPSHSLPQCGSFPASRWPSLLSSRLFSPHSRMCTRADATHIDKVTLLVAILGTLASTSVSTTVVLPITQLVLVLAGRPVSQLTLCVLFPPASGASTHLHLRLDRCTRFSGSFSLLFIRRYS